MGMLDLFFGGRKNSVEVQTATKQIESFVAAILMYCREKNIIISKKEKSLIMLYVYGIINRMVKKNLFKHSDHIYISSAICSKFFKSTAQEAVDLSDACISALSDSTLFLYGEWAADALEKWELDKNSEFEICCSLLEKSSRKSAK